MKVTTADRLRQLMAARHLRQVDILNACQPYCRRFGINLSKSSLSQYLSGKILPNQYKLTVLGLALDVSEAWLMGYDVPMEREAPVAGSEITDAEKDLLDLFRLIPADRRELVLGMIRAALQAGSAE